MSKEPPKVENLVGSTIDGRYRIESVLGQGGMGMVYRAVQMSMDRPVALKTLHAHLAFAPTFYERFRREAEIASRLNHPNIITVFEFGRAEDGLCYIAMEYLAGESLRQKVKREGPLSVRKATAIIEQAALGIAHAHRQGVIHRDIKPHNIMLQKLEGGDFVKVLDFGLVKALEESGEELTSTGQVLGTPQYMPPEQAGGDPVDQRSDIYALTACFYFALTGTSPYGAKTVRQALQAALTQAVPPIYTHRIGAPVPAGVDAFIKKGMAVEKEDRFQSCEEFIAAMKASLSPLGPAELDAAPERTNPGRESATGSSGVKGGKKSKQPSSLSSPRVIKTETRVTAALPEVRATAKALPLNTKKPVPTLAVVAASLVALTGVGVWFTQRENETPHGVVAPGATGTDAVVESPSQPAKVQLVLSTTPSGASVSEEGTLLGKTPLTLEWNRDEAHRLLFELSGYESSTKTFRLVKEEAIVVPLDRVADTAPRKPPAKNSGGKAKATPELKKNTEPEAVD